MNFDITGASILFFSRVSFASSNLDLVKSEPSDLKKSIALRFIVALVFLTLLFLIGVAFVNITFVNNYRLESQEENSASQKYLITKTNTREVDTFSTEPETSAIESDEEDIVDITSCSGNSDYEEYDSEALDTLDFLDKRSFYKNLNNSAQYLRRDSFSQ